MENQKEREEKMKKLIDLRKKIERKEKKLQKVNKVLKAKEHVQQKLKEVNKPEKYRNRINMVSKTTELDYTTGKQPTFQTNVPSSDPRSKREMSNFHNGILFNSFEPTPPGSRSTVNFEDGQFDVKTNKFSTEKKVIKEEPHNKNENTISENVIEDTTLDKHVMKCNSSIEKIHNGDSEELPIVIADSQPLSSNTTNISSDDSQNSRLETKIHLSLIRKRKSKCLTDVNTVKKQKWKTRDRTNRDEVSSEREINLDNSGEIIKKIQHKCNKKDAPIEYETDSDSLLLLQQTLYKDEEGLDLMFTSGNGKSSEGKIEQDSILEINLPEKDERKERSKNLKAGHVSKLESDCSTKTSCTSVESGAGKSGYLACSQNNLTQKCLSLAGKRGGWPLKYRKDNRLSIYTVKNKIIKDQSQTNSEESGQEFNYIPSRHCDMPSEKTVVECTADITLVEDLNKAFVQDERDQETFQINQQKINKIEVTHASFNLDWKTNLLSSSQETLFGSMQENSQPKRKGRISKIKQKPILAKTAFQVSPLFSENSKQKEKGNAVKDINKDKNNRADVSEFSQDVVIECTSNNPLEKMEVRYQGKCDFDNVKQGRQPTSTETSVNCDLGMRNENAIDKLEIIHIDKTANNRFSMSSQDSTASSVSSVTDKPLKRRGRPRKKKTSSIKQVKIDDKNETVINSVPMVATQKKGEIQLHNSFTEKRDLQTLCGNTNFDDTCLEDNEEITIPESQDIFDKPQIHIHKFQSSTERKQLKKNDRTNISKNSVEKMELSERNDSQNSDNGNCDSSHKTESPELSTLKLIQESFVEKKEYSTRRWSSMGSPFIISSIFQFLIDESRRKKENKDFDLPVQKFGKFIDKKQKVSVAREVTDVNVLEKLPKATINKLEHQSQEAKICTNFDCLKPVTMPVNFVDNIQIDKNDMPETNSKHNSNAVGLRQEQLQIKSTENVDKLDVDGCYESIHENSEKNKKDYSKSDTIQSNFTSSQSLFTPNPKKENGIEKTLNKSDQEAKYEDSQDSQTDSMDSLYDDVTGRCQNMSSLELPEDEKLVALCSCTLMYRRKEVPVIGCLSAKSLSLWKHHHNVFVFLHKWEFPDNHKAEKISSFSVEGKAFFIILLKTGDNQFEVMISYYRNKCEKFMFKAANIETEFIEACHINSRVIAVGYTKGKTIHVLKFILHNKWKSLATSERLEPTDGYLQSVHGIDNLPAAVCVWSSAGEFIIWNHESKRILLKIKPDCIGSIARLVGTAWEQGYYFLQLFYTIEDISAGVQVILNPATNTSCISNQYKSSRWKGFTKHHVTDEIVVTLEDNDNLCVWDRHSTDLISVSNQKHATFVTVIGGRIVTGGDHCVHVH